ncbi:hypothetical protein HPB48_013673 [Haemaphysalis longicornis]|uniref:Uncharacterized protein n=1 Tax=Haemaphysalis longicornis TaxID=44386 RepID=A0A9J6GQB4_HAELO|nr:hypothetical protein HPB48_013673 [Haemaphysalis longicornis]
MQKRNFPLRRRLAKLNQEISKLATYLSNQLWCALCDRIEGSMNVPQTSNILRGLLNPKKKRAHQEGYNHPPPHVIALRLHRLHLHIVHASY